MKKPNIVKYHAKNGAIQFKPSIEYLMALDDIEGFCLGCGETQRGIEPDAGKCICESCGKDKVYGKETIVWMSLTY